MFNTIENGNGFGFAFSSEMALVDRVVKSAGELLSREGGSSCLSALKLVLRELLINAVEHGNGGDSSKLVRCSIEPVTDELCKVCVEDEGSGFDWHSATLRMPDNPHELRNRGLPLVNALADKLEFNGSGNAVVAYVPLLCETSYVVSDGEEGWKVIAPKGNVTASSAERLREVFERLLAEGMNRCRIDMSNVVEVDSLGLSVLIVMARRLLSQKSTETPQIINVSKPLERIFRMAMLDALYVVRSREEAT